MRRSCPTWMGRSKGVEHMSEAFQNLFPQGGPNTVAGRYFSGASYLCPLSSEGGVSVANVTFEPGCRNNWHIHHKGGADPPVYRRPGLLPGVGQARPGAAPRRRGEHPSGGKALARSGPGQLVRPCGHLRPRLGGGMAGGRGRDGRSETEVNGSGGHAGGRCGLISSAGTPPWQRCSADWPEQHKS